MEHPVMNQPVPNPPSASEEWSHKLAELLRSMPADLREPTALKGVLLGAVRELNVPAPQPQASTAAPAARAPSASEASPVVATPVAPLAVGEPVAPAIDPVKASNASPQAPVDTGITMEINPSSNPEWVASLRQRPPVPSLKKVGAVLNQPMRMARELVETGAFDTQAFRAAYGNGWSPSNREFGRQFADEIARCTEQQIAQGAPWVSTTHHALVGLTALTAQVLTHGVNALMDRLAPHADASEAVSQSVATTLKNVLSHLPSGHPAYHEESGMLVRGQLLETLARRQEMEATMAADANVARTMGHLRRAVR